MAQQRGIETRRLLLSAALVEFASAGFDAASTRAIAARAGVRQGQLTYHFESKDVLWRATVDFLFERFDSEFTVPADAATEANPAQAFEALLRALVRAVAVLPELNRVMVHEATADSERLDWIVEHHVRPRFEQFSELWRLAQQAGATHLTADPLVVYYSVLGAASLLYVNYPEARRLQGEGAPPVVPGHVVEAHADALVAMFLKARSKRGSS